MPLLDVKNLRVRFETHHGTVKAVDGVSFQLEEGETLGLVGESGSGKSVTNLALMGLIPSPPGVVQAESVRFGKRDLLKIGEAELRKLRGNQIAMIFQDPMTSLNPLLTIERQLTEVLMLHKGLSRREARTRAAAGLGDVGIPDPEGRMDSYPHELSGGMRQRVMIAMGLLCKPRVLIADEPTTALDVTIQAQILELMKDLQHKHGMAIILVTHDLGVVAGMTDRINVMYAGRLAETAGCEELFSRPMHPYTKGLLQSVPTIGGDVHADLFSIPGSPPDLAALPPGCAFAPRCMSYVPRCDEAPPTLRAFKDPENGSPRRAACFELDRGEDATDPNRELFEALERQEREGVNTGVISWTPEAEPETAPGPESTPDSRPDPEIADQPESAADSAASVEVTDGDLETEQPEPLLEDDDDDEIPGLMGGDEASDTPDPESLDVAFVSHEELGLAPPREDDPPGGAFAVPDDEPEEADAETVAVSFEETGTDDADEGSELFQDLEADLEALDDDPEDDGEDPDLFAAPAADDEQPAGSLDLTDLEDDLDGEDWKWIGEPPLPEKRDEDDKETER